MRKGILVNYALDPEYFEIGCAFQIRLSTNNFKAGLLIDRSLDSVTFVILENNEITDLTLTIDQLRFHDYWLVKMRPDYTNGKFSY